MSIEGLVIHSRSTGRCTISSVVVYLNANLNGDRLGSEVCEREYRAHALERLFRLSGIIDTKAREITLAMRRKHRHKPQQANVIRITFCHLLNQVYAVTVFRHLTSRILRASVDSAEATAAR
jgi:hypothetical protein